MPDLAQEVPEVHNGAQPPQVRVSGNVEPGNELSSPSAFHGNHHHVR